MAEACRVRVDQAGGTLVTIAQDVKLEVELNPARVASDRLIGYEKRRLGRSGLRRRREECGRDRCEPPRPGTRRGRCARCRGRLGGVARRAPSEIPAVPGLVRCRRHRRVAHRLPARQDAGWGACERLEGVLAGPSSSLQETSETSRFAAAVALFGTVLQESEHVGEGDLNLVQLPARGALGTDEQGERAVFVRLLALVRELRC
ncbi:MAG: DUF3520 domain-containing protein [Deltaproteobacteria bacterium]|nr:DUF3520 domain-containing protein [Deltaproteobacteria bacterium]MBW2500774.1 DUF3520 domain-containing protein [Deltaproteobacteria bacterium]